MEIHTDFLEPVTSALSYNNASFWRAEDSGYHTSHTPGSVDLSEISNENIDPATVQGHIQISHPLQGDYNVTPELNFRLDRKYVRGKNVLAFTQTESTPGSPAKRRGVKRAYQDESEDVTPSSIPTPTSMIAGRIQKLKMTDSLTKPSQSRRTSSSDNSRYSDSIASDFFLLNEYAQNLSYPTTPVKRICRTSCKLSPMRKSNKKLHFAIHSLSCESNGVVKQRPNHKVVRTIQFRPDQKVDIIKMLYKDATVIPPIIKILDYLSYEDICQFKLVSPLWCQVWNHVSKAKKEEFRSFLKNKKDNQENKQKGLLRKHSDASQIRSLKEVHNLMNTHMESTPKQSSPGSPRTNKFKKFTKSALLDSRLQITCIRCNQPSKVTVELSGEEWAECTSSTCSYIFCKFCKCDRHPGKSCFKYDLEGPSPSKRKKSTKAACTSKSKRALYRLMI